jgi:alpha-glucosidase
MISNGEQNGEWMRDLKQIAHGMRLIGLGNIFRSIRMALKRQLLDAKHIPETEQGDPRPPGKFQWVEPSISGAKFKFEAGVLVLRFLQPDLVFVAWDGAGIMPSYAVIKEDWPKVKVSIERLGDGWRVCPTSPDVPIYKEESQTEQKESSPQSGGLAVEVQVDGALRITNQAGETLRYDEPAKRLARGWSSRIRLDPKDCIYGLGGRSADFNLRPGRYRFWNHDIGGSYGPGDDPLYICMPVYLCLGEAGSHLVFYDNTFDGWMDLGEAVRCGITWPRVHRRFYWSG